MNSAVRVAVDLCVISFVLAPRLQSQQVIVNELYNSGGSDEWIELLIVQDSLDLRGWSLRDFSSGGSAQNPLNFTTNALWSGLRAGTIIVVARPENTAMSEDTDLSDYLLLVKSGNSLYFGGTPFLFAGASDAVEIRNAAATHVFGVSWGSPNAASLSHPRVHFTGSSTSGTGVSFDGDSLSRTVDTGNWTFNNAANTPGAGNGPANAAWIGRLRLRADGSGSARVAPDTLAGGQTVPLAVIFRPDPSLTLTGLRIVIPTGFRWSHRPGDVSFTNMSASLALLGDTVTFDHPAFSADSTVITLASVTAPESTAFYPIRVESKVGSFSAVMPLPRIAVFGVPTAIGNVKPNDGNGIPLRSGELVTLRGIVTVGGEFGGPSFIQDNSGGIAVVATSLAAVGDEVVVSGILNALNGLSGIASPKLHAILTSGNLLEPLAVSCAQVSRDGAAGVEEFEGMLVRLNGVTVTDTSDNPVATWGVSGAGTNFRLHDAGGALDIRIDNSVNIGGTVAPVGAFDVIGVLSQFRTTAPYTGGYQVMPRSTSDIIASGPIISTFPVESLIRPNSLAVTWETLNPGTSHLRYGKTPALESGAAGNDSLVRSHTVLLSGLTPATVYYCRAFSAAGTDTSAASTLIASTASPQQSTGAINIWFNKSVLASLANPVPAAGNQDLPARIISRINNARQSVDAALYSLSGTPGENIAAALLAAKQRGVKVRLIVEADNRNSNAISLLAAGGIPLIDDAFDRVNAGGGYMHNKFFVVDGRGGAPESVWVWTGSWNPTFPGTFDDYQNAVEFQDAALAGAYLLEFEEMWGSGTETPAAAASRFGARKRDNTPHRFVIGGSSVECYFSPSDRTTAHIAAAIGAAERSIAAGTMTLTRADLAATLVAQKSGGRKVRIILDNNTDSGSQFGFLAGQGLDCRLKTGAGLFHHKYMIADAENPSGNPVVVTGSHNWSNSAENSNNENTVIIHNPAVANQYLQEFAARYYQFGGADTISAGLWPAMEGIPQGFALAQNFPNPFNPSTVIRYQLPSAGQVTLTVFDILGRKVATLVEARQRAGSYTVRFDARGLASGVYICRLAAGAQTAQRKMLLVR